jgi:hypothetical protein
MPAGGRGDHDGVGLTHGMEDRGGDECA